MFDIQNYGTFILAVIVFQLFPGAGTIMILNATASKGVSGGLKAVFGTLTGDFAYMLAAVLGLSAIFTAYPGILVSVQWLGAAYLCWVGWRLLRTSPAELPADMPLEKEGWACYRQALMVSLTNPKAIMFFLAFFPLFLGTESKVVTLLALMVHVTAISLLFQAGLVLAGDAVARRVSRWRYFRLIASRLAGIALIGFGAKLVMSNR